MPRSAIAFVLLALAFAPGVRAQPNPAPKSTSTPDIETIIVNGERTIDSETHAYVEQHVAPSVFLGKLTRWNKRNPLCPSANGFSADNATYIIKRISEIATQAGAPMSKDTSCKPNLSIIATTVPQGVMDEIRNHRSDLLGYDAGSSRADAVTTMKYPVQALYETATIDNRGSVTRDVVLSQDPNCGDYCAYFSTGWRARDGIESTFYNITIIVDARDIPAHPLSALADYLAIMALSQTDNFAPCQDIPSITNLLSRDCPSAGLTASVTATDIAFLRGLYASDAEASVAIQRATIAAEIRKSFVGR